MDYKGLVLTFVPTNANLFPGAKVEHRAYLEVMVDTHCCVDLETRKHHIMQTNKKLNHLIDTVNVKAEARTQE